jgi:hypothetical protein
MKIPVESPWGILGIRRIPHVEEGGSFVLRTITKIKEFEFVLRVFEERIVDNCGRGSSVNDTATDFGGLVV